MIRFLYLTNKNVCITYDGVKAAAMIWEGTFKRETVEEALHDAVLCKKAGEL